MKNVLLLLFGTIFLAPSFATTPSLYIKGGPNYLWYQSNDYSLQRINPIEGSLVPSIASASLNHGVWAGNIGLGITYPIQTGWQLSPELSYTGIERSSKTVNTFISTIDSAPVNYLHSMIDTNVLTAGLNIERIISEKYSIYIAPALGVAFVNTLNHLNYQASPDDTYFHMQSGKHRQNFSFQATAGIKYAMRSDLFVDAGLNYIWLGNIPLGAYSMDEDHYTETLISTRSAYLLGPRVNFIFYVN